MSAARFTDLIGILCRGSRARAGGTRSPMPAPVVGGGSMDDLLDETRFESDDERDLDWKTSATLEEEDEEPAPQPASSSADGGNPNPLDSSPFGKMGRASSRSNRMSEQYWARSGAANSGLGEEFESIHLIQTITSQASQALPAQMEEIAKKLFVTGGGSA